MQAMVNGPCIGCGLCAELCPAVFWMEETRAAAQYAPVPPQLETLVRKAAEDCPVDAIQLG